MTDPIPITRTAVWEDEVESVLTDLKNLAENFLLLESSLKLEKAKLERNSSTMLNCACYEEHEQMVELLLKRGADITARGATRALKEASRNQDKPIELLD
ncbi:hypothetical protein GX50_05810 [[Emmonsia] crescens]|uniref:Uncharacterized protein n=1 Tax=[Emmonsia] crescens TaxID=73230 RepID=A0A2B7ZEG5_9EURO|nr:hypothetical protein GX50_05810 [Emmonsia crescens]